MITLEGERYGSRIAFVFPELESVAGFVIDGLNSRERTAKNSPPRFLFIEPFETGRYFVGIRYMFESERRRFCATPDQDPTDVERQ